MEALRQARPKDRRQGVLAVPARDQSKAGDPRALAVWSKEFFADRIRRMKQFGFNYTKSCMEIFTQEFLEAADELGFLVCQEMPFGLTGKYRTTIREKMPDEYVELYRRELARAAPQEAPGALPRLREDRPDVHGEGPRAALRQRHGSCRRSRRPDDGQAALHLETHGDVPQDPLRWLVNR